MKRVELFSVRHIGCLGDWLPGNVEDADSGNPGEVVATWECNYCDKERVVSWNIVTGEIYYAYICSPSTVSMVYGDTSEGAK